MNTARQAFPEALDLRPVSRRPTMLSDETTRVVLAQPLPRVQPPAGNGRLQGLTSIIVVTFNNRAFTRICLESILASTTCVPYELIVVDNGSTDGTVEYLREIASRNRHVQAIFNGRNRGFAPANNQGVEAAAGDRLVLLNNDTIVPPSWLSRLVAHLDDPSVGIVSPVTNRSGNEAEIDVAYETYGAFLRFADGRYRSHLGVTSDISSLVMFCAALRRDVWDEVGPLDERFEVGMFEDDDYAMHLRSAGYRIACAEDTFVHHFGQATIGKLSLTGEYGHRFHTNRERWEEKWEQPWTSHRRRPNPTHDVLVQRVRTTARSIVPRDESVAVVSGGDDRLIELGPRRAVHFPCDTDGDYAGYHPRDSWEAIGQLESLRMQGTRYLIIPSTAFWWLDYYTGFRRYLKQQHQLLVHDLDSCAVFGLSPAEDSPPAPREEHSVA